MYGSFYGKIVALVMSISPITIAWPRMELTETLSISFSIWILAALVRSIKDKKIHWFELGVVCAIGIFLRYDFIILLIPITYIAFKIESMLVALVGSIPATAWWARSGSAGLPEFPPFGLTITGEEAPQGILRWMGTWVNSQYHLPKSVWPLVSGNYSDISPPNYVIKDGITDKLIENLTQLPQGFAVPDSLDKDFDKLARNWQKDHPLQQWVGLPIQRALNMWLNPFPSVGWPAEVGPEKRAKIVSALQAGDFSNVLNFVSDHYGPALMKATTFSWRILILTFFGGVIFVLVSKRMPCPLLLSASIIFVVIRTLFFAETILVETRYLIPAMVWLEFSLIITILSMTLNKSVIK